MIPLIRCRDCGSKLLQLEAAWLLGDGRHVADRHCPECGMADTVEITTFALRLWRAREDRLRRDLEVHAAMLADDDVTTLTPG